MSLGDVPETSCVLAIPAAGAVIVVGNGMVEAAAPVVAGTLEAAAPAVTGSLETYAPAVANKS